MTRDRDIEHVLEQWFTDGPSHMPDRLFNTVLDRVDASPQRRRFGRWAPGPLHVDRRYRLALAAAVIVIVAGVGVALFARLPSVGPDITPSPSPSNASESAVAEVPVDPSALPATWRAVYGRSVPTAKTPGMYASEVTVWFGAENMLLPGFKSDSLGSWSLLAPDELEMHLLTSSEDLNCNLGDVGTYLVSLRDADATMHLEPHGDTCEARAAILGGDWIRSDGGELTPGMHDTVFEPFVGAGGQASYVVPAGWTLLSDDVEDLTLGQRTSLEQTQILLLSDVAAYTPPIVESTSCGPPSVDAPKTAAELTAWLATLEGLLVTPAIPISVGGLSGLQVDVSVIPDDAGPVSASSDPLAEVPPGDPFIETFCMDDGRWNLTVWDDRHFWPRGPIREGRFRYLLLDRAEGSVVLISVGANRWIGDGGAGIQEIAWEDAMAEAMPVVNSFTFTP